MFPDLSSVELFEGSIAGCAVDMPSAALDHPDICTVHEIDEAEGHTFIAMAFIDGIPLKEKIESRPLPIEDVIRYAMQIGRGLQEPHAHDVVHRDVKSANVIIPRRDHAVVMDFGLAKLNGHTLGVILENVLAG